jgi:S1-C subfamily serine protease
VDFPDGTRQRARVLGSNARVDVALIQLEEAPPKSAKVAKIGNSDEVRVGAPVFVVGAPKGIGHTLTTGYVSARRSSTSSLGDKTVVEHFQTDAPINPGNSGGPMFDYNGNVIGLVSFMLSESGGSEGLGFALTSNVARKLMLERPSLWSGMDHVAISGAFSELLNVPEGAPGLLIQRVAKDSPTDRLGLRGGAVLMSLEGQELLLGGDIILSVFDIPVGTPKSESQITERLEQFVAGGDSEVLSVEVLRGGKILTLSGRAGDLIKR